MGKKRKAKHVLEAEQAHQEKKNTNTISLSTANKPEKKKQHKKKKKKVQVKDPQEAHSYLSTWQQNKKQKSQDSNIESIWRFNKNTQSWLIRHMYEVDKVPKGTFALLILYLEDLKGVSRERVYDDAVRRALRYKTWEKSSTKEDDDGEKSNDDDDDDNENEDNDQKEEEEDIKMDAKRWKNLDDHDKRKEYKRARKMIDLLKTDESTKS